VITPLLAQLPVQHEQSGALVFDHLQPLHDLVGPLLLLDLFRDEPLELCLGCVVILLDRKLVES
jgi:hypothetical protein